MPTDTIQLIQTGGVVGVLVVVLGLILTDRLITAKARDVLIGLLREIIARLQADRDDWKEQAKTAVRATERMADALEAQNRLLEAQNRAPR